MYTLLQSFARLLRDYTVSEEKSSNISEDQRPKGMYEGLSTAYDEMARVIVSIMIKCVDPCNISSPVTFSQSEKYTIVCVFYHQLICCITKLSLDQILCTCRGLVIYTH